jgi:hypothetical protein
MAGERIPDSSDHCGLILRVLSGEVTVKTHPGVFLDDILFNAVFKTESSDPDWLPSILSSGEWTLAGMKAVAGFLPESRREALRPLLGIAADEYGW